MRRLVPTQTSNLAIELHPQPGGDLSFCLRFLFEAEKGDWHNTLYVLTLQRRLSAEQTTYSSVIERTRAEMAGGLLESTDSTIAEIAHQLGYEYQGDFTRAFRRWAAVSPSEFRRRRQHA